MMLIDLPAVCFVPHPSLFVKTARSSFAKRRAPQGCTVAITQGLRKRTRTVSFLMPDVRVPRLTWNILDVALDPRLSPLSAGHGNTAKWQRRIALPQ